VQGNNTRNFNTIDTNDFYISKDEMETMNLEEIEKKLLQYFLENNNWNIKTVSKRLGQTPRNIYRKIQKYNIIR